MADSTPSGKGLRVGVIGTGMLGGAVAARLSAGGYGVCAYNRTRQKTDAARTAGATILGSPAEVAEVSDIILIIVRDAEAVRDVSFGKGGIVSGAHDGMVVADMSTIGPGDSRDISASYGRRGIAKLDVPVMGGPDAAAAGSLVAMVSGSRKAYESCAEVLEYMAQNVFFLGTEPGTAHVIKLAMNMQITMLALSLAEGISLVEAAGGSPKAFLDVLNSTYFGTGMSRKKAYKMITGSGQEPTFTLANLRKDIGIMTDAAKSLGVCLPMISAAERVYDEAQKNGHGGIDYTGIIRQIRGSQDGAREASQQS